MINGARSDHYHLYKSLSKINVVNSSMYDCGQEEQDINHILWQCRLFEQQRHLLIEKLHKLKLQLPLCIEMLISEPNVFACKCIHEFINKCNLKI